MKRIYSGMLLFSLLIFLMRVNVLAADGKTTLSVDQVNTETGDVIQVPIRIFDNVGICGALISVAYDESLKLVGISSGDAFASLEMTQPGNYQENPIKILWDGTDADVTNGEIAILAFESINNEESYDISVSYDAGDVIDEQLNSLELVVENGSVDVTAHEHSGGLATCVSKAICEKCGEEYGDVDRANHIGETEIRNAIDATITEEGYTGDTYCSSCDTLIAGGEAIPKLVIDDAAVSIVLTGGKVTAGNEVTVIAAIRNNPGIAGFSYDVNYDHSVFTLNSVSAGQLIAGQGQLSANGDVINWYSSENITSDGELLELTFSVAKKTKPGKTAVSISLHEGKKNLVDESGIFIDAVYAAGIIEVNTGVTGDINGDDDITIADVVLINRHVLGMYAIASEKQVFADINEDGDISIGDVVLLNRHVLGIINLFSENEVTPIRRALRMRTASSNDGIRIYTEDICMEVGATENIPVYLSNNTGMAGMALSVNVPEGYTLNSIQAGAMLEGGIFTANGANCTWYAAENITSDGILMTLNVTAGENAKSGQIAIGVKDGKANNLSDEMGQTVAVEFGIGNVTINAEAASECEQNGHRGGTATCISGAKCEVCGEKYGEPDPANHTGRTEVRNEKAATVSENGYTGDVYCADCNVLLETGTVIAAVGKVNIGVGSSTARTGDELEVPIQITGNTGIAGFAFTAILPAGVTLNGIEKGDVLSEGTFSVDGNNCTWYTSDNLKGDGVLLRLKLKVEENAESGAIAIGLKDGKENNFSDENGETVPVSFSAGTLTIESRTECEINGHRGGTATCKEPAICEVCKEPYGTVDQNNHTGETEIRDKKDATCTEDGYTGDVYCKACEQLITKGEAVQKSGHTWDAGSVTKPVTCTENGVKTYKCTSCQETKTEDILCAGHIGETELRNVLNATCTQEGYTGDSYCKACGEMISAGAAVAKTEHQWDEGTLTKLATCTETGIKTYTCAACGQTKTEDVPCTGHTGETEIRNAVNATCSSEGYTGDAYCKACGGLISSGTAVEKTEHQWDAGIVTTQPTGQTGGVKTYTCQICSATRTESIEALGIVGLSVGTEIKDTKSNGYYKIASDGFSVEYTGPVNKKMTSVSIPDIVVYEGVTCRVTSIAANAFKGNKYIRKVRIGNNIISLGKKCFYGCKKLNTVTFGNHVASIGAYAFAKDTALKKITLPASVESIGSRAFYGCKKLKNITIKTKLLTKKNVGSKAFKGIYSKPTVSVPRSVYSSYKKILKAKGMSSKAKYKKF